MALPCQPTGNILACVCPPVSMLRPAQSYRAGQPCSSATNIKIPVFLSKCMMASNATMPLLAAPPRLLLLPVRPLLVMLLLVTA